MKGKGLHASLKQKAQRPGGVSLSELKPNSQEIAKRLLKQGALHPVGGGKFQWQGD